MLIQNVAGARYSNNTIQNVVGARSAISGLVQNVVGARYTNNTVQNVAGARVSFPKILQVCVGARYRCDIPITSGPMIKVDGVTRYPTYDDFTKGRADIANYSDGYETTYQAFKDGVAYPIDIMAGFNVKLKDSAPMEWTLKLIDADQNHFDPRRPSSPWFGIMTNRPFASNRISYNRQLVATIKYAGRTFVYNGIPTKTGSSGRGTEMSRSFTWSGQDRSLILFRKMQTFPSVRTAGMTFNASTGTSTGQTFISAMNEVTKLCTAVNIPVNLSGMEDFVIPLQHRQNTDCMSIIKEIIDVPVCEWGFFGGDVFHVYKPNMNPTETYDFTATGGRTADEWIDDTWESDLKVTYNKAIFSRLQEAGAVTNLIATDFRQYEVSFQTPVNRLRWQVLEASNGQFVAFEFYAGAALVATSNLTPSPIGGVGYPINTTVAGVGGVLNGITKVKVTWGAQPGVIDTGGYGRIVFIGTPNGQVDWGSGGWNDVFSYTVFNPGADPALGEMGVEHIQTPIIPTYEWLVLHAIRWILNYGAQEQQLTRKVRLNPSIVNGMSLLEKVPGYPDTVYYIPEVEHNFDPDPLKRYTKYTGIYYDTSVAPISPYDWTVANAKAFKLTDGVLGGQGAL